MDVSERSRALWVTLGYLFSLAGVYLSSVLASSHSMALSLPCGTSDGCDVVALSAVSRIFGVPIAYFGLLAYLTLVAGTAVAIANDQPRYLKWLHHLALLCAVASTGLTVYSVVVLRATCIWCVLSNADFALIAIFLTIAASHPSSRVRSGNLSFIPGAAFVACLATGYSIQELGARHRRLPVDVVALSQTSGRSIAPFDRLETGPRHAAETFVVFVDMQCEACHMLVPELIRSSESRKARLVIRHLPLGEHADSALLARWVELARLQGKGWAYFRQALDGHLEEPEQFAALAKKLGVELEDRVLGPVARSNVDEDVALAKRLQLVGTPSILRFVSGKAVEMVSMERFRSSFKG